jgi:hypothetical protein
MGFAHGFVPLIASRFTPWVWSSVSYFTYQGKIENKSPRPLNYCFLLLKRSFCFLSNNDNNLMSGGFAKSTPDKCNNQ